MALHAYFDAFSGVSGNMLLGALLELGWPEAELLDLPARLGLEGVSVEIEKVRRGAISANLVEVVLPNVAQPKRKLADIEALIEGADLPSGVKAKAKEVFCLLASAEAKVHGIGEEDVHFHEVGAADALIDIVGSVLGFYFLKIESVYSSPLPLSRGWVNTAHGRLPLPAPAVVELLKDWPVSWQDEPFEYVTPTGAALIRILSRPGHPEGIFRIKAVGCGAGNGQLHDRPNLLRLILYEKDERGDESSPSSFAITDEVIEIRCVMDDMNPEIAAYLAERLFEAGALDCWQVPVHMKKGRTGIELVCLAHLDMEARISELIFKESSTSGIRLYRSRRRVLERQIVDIDTEFGPVKVKRIIRPGGREDLVPEYEECRALALRHGLPLQQVYKMVAAAAMGQSKKKGRASDGSR